MAIYEKDGILTKIDEAGDEYRLFPKTKTENVDGLQDELNGKLPKAGGTLTGELAMSGKKITGLGTPTNDSDAVTKSYSDNTFLKKTAVSNPNLIENWYWKKPVNQKGNTSYTAEGMTIDRWRLSLNSTAGGVEVGDGYVRLYNNSTPTNSNTCAIIHKFENPSRFAGKQVTVSVKFKSFYADGDPTGTSYDAAGPRIVFRDANTSDYLKRSKTLTGQSLDNTIFTFTTTLPNITDTLDMSIGNLSRESGRGKIDLKIEAVKVEFGAISTLEYDLLNDSYSYAEELAICSQYDPNSGNRVWVNPPMKNGVEYQIAETFLGNPVYTMAFDFGVLPTSPTGSALDYVTIPTDLTIISFDGYVIGNGYIYPIWKFPKIADINYDRTTGFFKVTTNQNASSWSAVFILKYFK